MVKQREGWKVLISKEAQDRIDNSCCPACGKHKNFWSRRKDWACCSVKCTDKFTRESVTFGWNDLRLKAFKRDNYTCAVCKIRYDDDSLLIGDHIVSIACGGDEWDINNVQTLCIECNKEKTRKDMKLIAKERYKEKVMQEGQQSLTGGI